MHNSTARFPDDLDDLEGQDRPATTIQSAYRRRPCDKRAMFDYLDY